MSANCIVRSWVSAILAALAFGSTSITLVAQDLAVIPGKMPAIGTVDEPFQSYNIEMVEVVGGRFWKPHGNRVNTGE